MIMLSCCNTTSSSSIYNNNQKMMKLSSNKGRRRQRSSSLSLSALLLLLLSMTLFMMIDIIIVVNGEDINKEDDDGTGETAVADENEWKKTIGDKFYTNVSYYHDIVPKYMGRLLNTEEINQLHISDPDLTVIIHVGPMKTRCTYLQSSFTSVLGANKNQYESYVDVYNALQSYHPDAGPAHLIGCFRDPATDDWGFIKCKPEVLKTIHDIASIRKKNLIISAEFLPGSETNIGALKEYLNPWARQRIVAYYRRYYDWIITFHDQGNRLLTIPNRKSLITFLQNEMEGEYWYINRYIVTCIDRYKKHFHDIVIFNMHNTLEIPNGDIRENFYCLALLNGTEICNKYHRKAWLKMDLQLQQQDINYDWKKSHLVPFIYEELAYYSYHMNLWNEKSSKTKEKITIDDVALMIQHYQEYILKLNQYDYGIAKECPNELLRQYYLQKTLETELLLLPDYFNNYGYDEIKLEFDIYANTKLCYINPQIVLTQNNNNGTIWKNFFTNILPTM